MQVTCQRCGSTDIKRGTWYWTCQRCGERCGDSLPPDDWDDADILCGDSEDD